MVGKEKSWSPSEVIRSRGIKYCILLNFVLYVPICCGGTHNIEL